MPREISRGLPDDRLSYPEPVDRFGRSHSCAYQADAQKKSADTRRIRFFSEIFAKGNGLDFLLSDIHIADDDIEVAHEHDIITLRFHTAAFKRFAPAFSRISEPPM